MDKKKIRFIQFAIPAIFLVLFFIIGNDRLALIVQKSLNANRVFYIGNAEINIPEDWVQTYKKSKTDSIGYLYGFFPMEYKNGNPNEVTYIFKKIGKDEEIIFSELDLAFKEKAKSVLLAFSDNLNKGHVEVFQIDGFKAIKIKNNDSGYSISVPDLDLYVVTNSKNDLLDFKAVRRTN